MATYEPTLLDVESLPRFFCHKIVRAAKITNISGAEANVSDPAAFDSTIGLRYGEAFWVVRMSDRWMQRFKPEVGGYFVVYEDGYISFSPADVFEKSYTEVK